MNHKQYIHHWISQLDNLNTVVDMTAGNGHDTLFLAQHAKHVIAVDIQIDAIKATQVRCKEHSNITYKHASNDDIGLDKPVDGLVYNLGYLPGSDKTIITTANTTLKSLENALPYVKRFIIISSYRKHEGGNEEYLAIRSFIEKNFTQVEVLEYETELSPVTFIIRL